MRNFCAKIANLATLEILQKLATLKSIQHWQQDKCRWAICRRRRHHCYWPLFVYVCVGNSYLGKD